ncbi:MAG: NUDIX hydrolase [Anaerolineales bacterium]|jgi:ADP-ribose pyrophosphatase
MKHKIIESTHMFSGHVFDVRRDTIRTPEGADMQVDIVEHSGAVAIIPIDADDNVLFVRQYRHPAGKVLLELPAGTLEVGEDPERCARRESREEIGYEPEVLVKLGGGFMAPGYSTEFIHFFVARDLKLAPLPQDEDEDIELERLPLEKARKLVLSGRIEDVKTIAGLALLEASLSASPGE